MYEAMKRPEEILEYRTLRQMLVAKPAGLWKVSPNDSVFTALQIMADKDIGFLLVMEQDDLVGVVSERDCARRAILSAEPLQTTHVSEIMVRVVVTVDIALTFADCLRLMHQHGIRHLPVTDNGKVIAVVSLRDLAREAVTHNAKLIAEIELERLSTTAATA